ncbi:MAG: hypothetical protein KatS3mg082_2487 [Nitrospiraceae bacterium]|nr:MAG: hypothetical protein KatS3mg082_2487 [Nitrospiraceae bacterium]
MTESRAASGEIATVGRTSRPVSATSRQIGCAQSSGRIPGVP